MECFSCRCSGTDRDAGRRRWRDCRHLLLLPGRVHGSCRSERAAASSGDVVDRHARRPRPIRRRSKGRSILSGRIRSLQTWRIGSGALAGRRLFRGKILPGTWLLSRNAWPEVYQRTYKFLNSLDYMNLRLTGRFVATVDSILTSWVTDNRDPGNIRYDTEADCPIRHSPGEVAGHCALYGRARPPVGFGRPGIRASGEIRLWWQAPWTIRQRLLDREQFATEKLTSISAHPLGLALMFLAKRQIYSRKSHLCLALSRAAIWRLPFSRRPARIFDFSPTKFFSIRTGSAAPRPARHLFAPG